MKKLLQSVLAASMVFQFVSVSAMAQEETNEDDVVVEEVEKAIDEVVSSEEIKDEDEIVVTEDVVEKTAQSESSNPGTNGKQVTGWQKMNGKWYYYGTDGKQVSGWKKINNKWYYLDPEDNNAMACATGVFINDVMYVFDDNGVWVEKGWLKSRGEWYYLDSPTQPHNGWLKYNGDWYYLFRGYMVYDTCIDVGNNEIYCFDQTGRMVVNKWYDGGDGAWYYYGSDGKQVSGWKKINNKWYYFDPNNDNAMVSSDILRMNDTPYVFADNGVWVEKGWFLYSGKWNYWATSTTPYHGWLKQGNYWYYLDSGFMISGSRYHVKDTVYIFDEKGHMMSNKWENMLGDWYYYGSDGKQVSGWKKINNIWYYFNPDNQNAMASNCTLTLSDGKTYTFDSKGKYTKV